MSFLFRTSSMQKCQGISENAEFMTIELTGIYQLQLPASDIEWCEGHARFTEVPIILICRCNQGQPWHMCGQARRVNETLGDWSTSNTYSKCSRVLPTFQIVCRFNKSICIIFTMHLNKYYVQIHDKNFVSRFAKTTYNLERREYESMQGVESGRVVQRLFIIYFYQLI